ncbi:MAG: glycosyltransferase family 9 protein [Melioribacteraceae bacterium]|nr:glycosyltransferase family 9 protein [Melioribacteraceae bacterium]MCF8265956.1 glycosyltransferase family 9 protein [Melioribacteraceae bacterium]MCF8432740.1 glycosyltransferase family 9 protein [Melioribacteraceae bacterium]
MPQLKFLEKVVNKFVLSSKKVSDKKIPNINTPKRILIIRQHNQFGDLLATTPLFRGLRECYPNVEISIVVSPQNFYAITQNEYIDREFIFDKKRLFNKKYRSELMKFLRHNYEIVIVPVTVAISNTSCVLAAFSDAKIRIGPNSLEGEINPLRKLFHFPIDLNWSVTPDRHVSDFGQDILKPLGASTDNLKANVNSSEADKSEVGKFLDSLNLSNNTKLVGFHIGAGKPPNRWDMKNFVKLIELINHEFNCVYYFTGSQADSDQFIELKSLIDFEPNLFVDRSIPELAALIEKSKLFITNDTGVMHVAGATSTNQISLFGPTNPKNWGPVGENKINIKLTDNINDISVEEVIPFVRKFLK